MSSPQPSKDELLAAYVAACRNVEALEKIEEAGKCSPYVGSIINAEDRSTAELFDACIAAGITHEEIRNALGEADGGQ